MTEYVADAVKIGDEITKTFINSRQGIHQLIKGKITVIAWV